ncbi:MAG: tol-pal system protein YbgF [Thermodesulfobacteriota bacterium]|nr:MAG: tol-pal system protein YbgF [Thermodesulfobacteriota bacterium]
MKRYRRYILLALLAPLALVFTGCGPGFPLMTAEQEQLVKNVDTLMKGNQELKERISALEGGGPGGGAEDIKMTVAEALNSVEEMRRELSFIRGTIEDSENQRAQLAEDMAAVNEALKNLEEKMAARGVAGGETFGDAGEIAALKDAVMENREKIAAIEATIASMGKKAEAPRKTVPAREDPEEMYFRGYRLVKDGEMDKAAGVFKDFLQVYPKHKLADHARYWLGEIYYSQGDWERAILEFDKVIKEYPKGDKVPAATLKEGFSFLKLGAPKEARLLLERVVEKFPEAPEAEIAKKRLEELK